MDWRTRTTICDAGRPVNEDACGTSGRFAWIADGAGAAGPSHFARHGSDAAWLVREVGRCLDRLLDDNDPDVDVETACGVLETYLDAEWGTRKTGDPAGGPTCCLLVARIDDDRRVEMAVIGDVVALAPDADGQIQVITDERVKPFEALSLAALGTAPRLDGDMPAAARARIQANRALMNMPAGFPLVCPNAEWADQMITAEIVLPPRKPLVLVSDGFYRLVDVFGRYTDASLYAACAAGRGDALLAELRAIEHEDAGMSRYPRFKVHDDATLLVVSPAQ